MPSALIWHLSKFKWVTWLLLSKAFARTCTLQRSGEAGTVKDLQHHASTVATSMWASSYSFLEKFSSAMQVSFRTDAKAWPSNHPMKWLHFYWNDLMILFHPFFNLYMLSLVFDLLDKQGAAMNWTTLFLVQGPPVDMSRSQASSCLVVCENTLLAGMYLIVPVWPVVTQLDRKETIQVLQATSGIFRTL